MFIIIIIIIIYRYKNMWVETAKYIICINISEW